MVSGVAVSPGMCVPAPVDSAFNLHHFCSFLFLCTLFLRAILFVCVLPSGACESQFSASVPEGLWVRAHTKTVWYKLTKRNLSQRLSDFVSIECECMYYCARAFPPEAMFQRPTVSSFLASFFFVVDISFVFVSFLLPSACSLFLFRFFGLFTFRM